MNWDLTPGWRLRAILAAVAIPPLLTLVSMVRLAPRLGRPARAWPNDAVDAGMAEWVDRVLRALPWPWRHTCLTRSAVLYHLLRGAGRPVALAIGVKRTDGAFAAHAWLTRDGAPYLEADLDHAASYQVIAMFPETPAVTG